MGRGRINLCWCLRSVSFHACIGFCTSFKFRHSWLHHFWCNRLLSFVRSRWGQHDEIALATLLIDAACRLHSALVALWKIKIGRKSFVFLPSSCFLDGVLSLFWSHRHMRMLANTNLKFVAIVCRESKCYILFVLISCDEPFFPSGIPLVLLMCWNSGETRRDFSFERFFYLFCVVNLWVVHSLFSIKQFVCQSRLSQMVMGALFVCLVLNVAGQEHSLDSTYMLQIRAQSPRALQEIKEAEEIKEA